MHLYTGSYSSLTAYNPPKEEFPIFYNSSLLNVLKKKNKRICEPFNYSVLISPYKTNNTISRVDLKVDSCEYPKYIFSYKDSLTGSCYNARTLSHRTKKKIQQKAQALFECSDKNRFSFVTLSFIGKVADRLGKDCLNTMLTRMRKQYEFEYIWTAERQENFNIHFHIICNNFFDVEKCNKMWVEIQNNAGIINSAISKETISHHVNSNKVQEILNPFDVKKIYNVDGVSAYITKYVTKNNASFWCSAWHCSRGVSKLFTKSIVTQSDYLFCKDARNNTYINKNTGEVFEPKVFQNDYAEVVTINNKKSVFDKCFKELKKINKIIIRGILPPCRSSLPFIHILDYSRHFINKKLTIIKKEFQNIMLTAKFYMLKFGVCYKTALKMIKADKQKLNVMYLLPEHFETLYKVKVCKKWQLVE